MITLFWLSLGAVVYAYLGYPALLALLVRIRSQPLRRGVIQPRLSLILVVRDGADWLERKLQSIAALDYPADRLEVLLVSDGSQDATVELARQHAGERFQVLVETTPRGKAACLNLAVARASGEILVFTDVRQRLAVDSVRELVQAFADPAVAGVSGELVLEADDSSGLAAGLDLYWRLEKWIRRHEAQLASVVGVTGALYALRRSAYRPIPAETLLDDVLIPMQAVLDGGRIVFEQRARAFDIPSTSQSRERRRKIRTIAGNYQLLWLCPGLLNPLRNPVWWQFLSHKLARLLVPVALVIALLTNLVLAMNLPVYRLLLGAQLAIYGSAALGILWPVLQRERVVRIPATFVLLNWFAVLGLMQFARSRGRGLPW